MVEPSPENDAGEKYLDAERPAAVELDPDPEAPADAEDTYDGRDAEREATELVELAELAELVEENAATSLDQPSEDVE